MKGITFSGLLAACFLLPLTAIAQQSVALTDLKPLVTKLQSVVETSDGEEFLSLLTHDVDVVSALDFIEDALPNRVTKAVAVARFLRPAEDTLGDSRYRLTVEVFVEDGDRGQLQTWQLDVTRTRLTDGSLGPWKIFGYESPDVLEGLHHLSLDPGYQFDARGLVITAEDMTLIMSQGAGFVTEIDSGITGLVLVGNGALQFSPYPQAERRQIEILAGRNTLETEFTHAFIRLNPSIVATRLTAGSLDGVVVNQKAFSQAQAVFDELADLTFVVDLADLSDRTWWLTPSPGNFVAEIRTREYGDLTYTQAAQQPEDISLYTRNPARIISLYPSASRRIEQSRYAGARDTVSFDVLDYNIEASFDPRGVGRESLGARPTLVGCWIEGTARLALRLKDEPLETLTLQLANELRVHSVSSRELGALLFFRMQDRDDIIINLPTGIPAETEFTILVRYSGLLEAEELEENWIGRMRFLDVGGTATYGIPERRYLYTNASHWYPQPTNSDYATATMALSVPADYGIIASGDPEDSNPPVEAIKGVSGNRTYSFVTVQPTRYLSCFITRFARDTTPPVKIVLDQQPQSFRSGVSYDSLALSVEANEFSRDTIGDMVEKTTSIMRFYSSLLYDIPYPTFTLALSDSRLPGGHSPAYFAVLNQPLPAHGRLMRTWRTDPVAFSSYPSFFLAHELAHQWWGQAVGWRNYHEQWLSEGLAQYFAVLYAREEHGERAFADVLSQLREWSLRHSNQGPVYLGYRLGHLTEEPRVFRALVYNKSALVLHMLRRLIGDEAFFDGLRRFYDDMRFKSARTKDLIKAFEIEAARSLEDFFARWIYEFDVPVLNFDYRTERRIADPSLTDVVLRFRQEGKLFEIPVTVTLNYRTGADETLVVPISKQTTEMRVPLRGPLRSLDVNPDNAALAEIRR